MVKVEAALEAHVADAAGYLKPSFKLAGAGDNAAGRSANALLDKCRADLRRELEAYKKGWTAPKPKRWDELNPTAYAIALLIVGALITALIAVVTGTSG